MGPALGLSRQLIDSPKTVSAELIGKEQLISPWMISGIERPLVPLQNAPMEPPRPLRRESTAVMAANIGRELLRNLLIDSARRPRRIER